MPTLSEWAAAILLEPTPPPETNDSSGRRVCQGRVWSIWDMRPTWRPPGRLRACSHGVSSSKRTVCPGPWKTWMAIVP